jgi:hypothetical protein
MIDIVDECCGEPPQIVSFCSKPPPGTFPDYITLENYEKLSNGEAELYRYMWYPLFDLEVAVFVGPPDAICSYK